MRREKEDYYPKNDPSAIPRLMKQTERENQDLASENFFLDKRIARRLRKRRLAGYLFFTPCNGKFRFKVF